MLPRHAYLSALGLALAATMSEEDSPVVPSPEPDEGAMDYDATLGRWDEAADEPEDKPHTELCRRDINAFTEHVLSDEPLRTGYTEIDAALTGAVGGSLNFMIGGPSRGGQNMYKEYLKREAENLRAAGIGVDLNSVRPEQRASKKARAKRKAKKGWA